MKSFIIVFFFSVLSYSQAICDEAQQLILEKKHTEAQRKLEPIVKQQPDDLCAIELLGDTYGYQKKWDKAAGHYKYLITKKPNNGDYYYKYGGVLGMKALSVNKFKALSIIGDVKEAFLKASELDKNHIDVRWAMVELYMQLPGFIGGSKSKSLKYASELEHLSKVDGYLAKGYIYEYDDEPELAEKFYKLALSESNKLYFSKDNSLKQTLRIAMYYQIGKVCADYNLQLSKGIFCLKEYLKNYTLKEGVPKAWAYYRLSQIYKHQKNKTEALKWIEKAIKGLPKIEVFQTEKEQILNL